MQPGEESNALEEGDILLPGDVPTNLKSFNGALLLGPGLRRHPTEQNAVVVTKCGTFCHKPPNVYWINTQQKRYIPKVGETVVGVVVAKRGDILKIDIEGSELASLSIYSFEGATKKQKPDVQIGDAVFAKLLSASREMEPELVCVDSLFKAGRLGLLSNDGFVFNIGLNFAGRLLRIGNSLLKTLGKTMHYEIAVGMNGKVWVNAKHLNDVDTIFRALDIAEKQSDTDIEIACNRSK